MIGGIDVLNLVATKNEYVQLLVSYSGLEGVGIFILGSISLISRIFASEPEPEGKVKDGSKTTGTTGTPKGNEPN